jgi:hypothetical protein
VGRGDFIDELLPPDEVGGLGQRGRKAGEAQGTERKRAEAPE